MQLTRSKWFLPLQAVALGIVVFAAQWVGGDPVGGLESLAIMTAFGALILFGVRSETIRGLCGDGRDERFRKINIQATALSGRAMWLAVIVGSLVELAEGHRPGVYGWLAAIGGVAYLIAIVALPIRTVDATTDELASKPQEALRSEE
jgi:hypothetical protein